MLDSVRTVLLKRALVSPSELYDLSSSQIDQLLEKNYGKNWKVQYGLETQAQADKRKKVSKKLKYIPIKSQKELDDEFDKKMEAKGDKK